MDSSDDDGDSANEEGRTPFVKGRRSRAVALSILSVCVVAVCLAAARAFVGAQQQQQGGQGDSFQFASKGKHAPVGALDVVDGSVENENAFMSRLQVVAWGVLGTQLTSFGQVLRKAPLPDETTAIVDPAGLPYIQSYGPSRAAGASGALYKWLGIINDDSFPKDVQNSIRKELDAHYHAYGNKKVIHSVGPDLRQAPYLGSDPSVVVKALSTVYHNILAEFARAPGLTKLRMLPVSGGIFSGEFAPELPEITAKALALGFGQLSAAERQQVLSASALDMCIFAEREFDTYSEALKPRSPVLRR